MYFSPDPFTQQSAYIYRSSFSLTYPVVTLSLSLSLYPSQSQCITALASNTNSTFRSRRSTTTTAVQLQVGIYKNSYSAAVNNHLHVLFLMWGYFFFGKTTILRVRFRQLLDVSTPGKRKMSTCVPQTMPARHRWEKFLFGRVNSSTVRRKTWKKCVISYPGALKGNLPPSCTHA